MSRYGVLRGAERQLWRRIGAATCCDPFRIDRAGPVIHPTNLRTPPPLRTAGARKFENGAEGVLEFSGIDALASGDRLEVYGDSGTKTYDFGSDVINAGRIGDRALHQVEITPELEGGWHVEDDFIAAVKSKGRVRPHPDFEEGMRYMRVVQAVADSRARNEWVEIKH